MKLSTQKRLLHFVLQILLNDHVVKSSLATKYIGCSLGIILTGIELLSRARYY
jgi:hypothetical protein